MSKEEKKDSLVGLFSTRKTQARIDARALLGTQASSSQERATATTPALNRPDGQANLTGHIDAPGAPSAEAVARAAQPRKGMMSALASTILREARRELGTEFNYAGAEGQNKPIEESAIVKAVDKVLRRREESLDDIERANIIIHLQKDLLGWGVLQPLMDNKEVTDIHCYDYQTVVLQRGKVSENTGLHWPNHQAYVTFIDRLLMRLGKSLSTQQHTIDASYPNGVRICAIHESVCGSRGPLLSIRVPRIIDASLEGIVSYQVAPPLIVDYLAALTRSGLATFIISGETGTGKTTLMRCLATEFGSTESIVSVEDTPELNLQHPFYRSLVSRTANIEGVGEVTLQEHIKTTLRMTPTRVLLGEMRTPLAAESFLEAAQTGHVGMTTVHARNARETLVRLESLLGRAQKSVAIEILRQQIALAVDLVIWLFREKGTGKPRIGEIIEVGHYIEGAIQVRPMFTLVKTGRQPVWRVDSWSSSFDEVLSRAGIYLGDSPPEITLSSVSTTKRPPKGEQAS